MPQPCSREQLLHHRWTTAAGMMILILFAVCGCGGLLLSIPATSWTVTSILPRLPTQKIYRAPTATTIITNSNSSSSREEVHEKFDFFQAEGYVTGAHQDTYELGYVLSCWQANNLTNDQKMQYKFHVVNVDDYGAVGDGQTLNTQSFRKAFKAASRLIHFDTNNGNNNNNNNNNINNNSSSSSNSDANSRRLVSIVVVRNGVYKIGGTIDIFSHTFLYLDNTAVIMGSFSEVDFPYPEAWESEGNPLFPRGILPILVRAKHQNVVGIFGHGTIDGGALPGYIDGFNATIDRFRPRLFRQTVDPPCQGECRPQLVLLQDCKTVIVQDVTLQNSPDWTLHVRGTVNALFSRLHIHGDNRWPNNDGVDIDSCTNVTMSHSTIEVADDAICVKTTKGYGTTNNLLVQNNKVKSRSSAFKIGSSTQENISNVFVDQLTISAGTNRGIAIQHRDGGDIYNIHFRNIFIEGTAIQPIHWWGTGEPIYITSNPRYENNWPLGRVSNVLQ